MTTQQAAPIRDLAQSLVQAVLTAADPGHLLQPAIDYSEGKLTIGPNHLSLPDDGRLLLIALGKAAAAMTASTMEILGDRVDEGLVTLLPDQKIKFPDPIKTFHCGHPLPDKGSLAAGAAAADLLEDMKPEDRVLVLVSGGGSAMFEHLPPGIELAALASLTKNMLHAGLSIDQINQVRRRLSLVKAGGLTRLAAPAMTIGLILSDVIGNHLELVASGPTITEQGTVDEAASILKDQRLWEALPEQVKSQLAQPVQSGALIFQPINLLIGGNEVAIEAVEGLLAAEGFSVRISTSTMAGEARDLGHVFGGEVADLEPGQALIMGGEATVTVQKDGQGGPMQELALAAALELAEASPRQLLTFTTDGVDGASPAAGAVIDQSSLSKLRRQNIDPTDSLANNDSYRALKAIEATIETGHTGTNINDIVVGWCPPKSPK